MIMSSLKIHILPALKDNYIFVLSIEDEAVVVDPGDGEVVLDYLEQEELNLKDILLTHHHPDHVAGVGPLRTKFGAHVYCSSYDKFRLSLADTAVAGEVDFEVLGQVFTAIECPGHTLGHVAYYFEAAEALFCGDTLFSMGCGRLFEGTAEQMFHSLERLRKLPDETRVFCGHEYTQSNLDFALSLEPKHRTLQTFRKLVDDQRDQNQPSVPSLLGTEKQLNPFLRWDDSKLRLALKMEKATDLEVFTELRLRKDSF